MSSPAPTRWQQLRQRVEAQQARLLAQLDRVPVSRRLGTSLLELLRRVGRDVSKPAFTLNASAMAFNFFLALFPALIAFFSLIPYIPIENLEENAKGWMEGVLPPAAMELIESTLHELFVSRNAGILSIAFATVVYSSMRGLYTLFNAFEDLAHSRIRRPFYIKYLLALLLALLLFVLAVLLIAVYLVVELVAANVLAFMAFDEAQVWMLFLLRNAFTLAILYFSIALTYKVAAPRSMHMPFFSLGTTLATLLLWLALFGLRVFFANFTNYNSVYGSLTAVIVLMVWFYWLSNILLLGYDVHIKSNWRERN